MKPLLKVCGVTAAEFAAAAARRGVDYIGTIFVAQSPRCVDSATARAVAEAARGTGAPVRIVGVFAGQTAEEIVGIAAEIPLDVVQLHGEYGDGDVRFIKARGLETWRLDRGGGPVEDAVLLDGAAGGRTGGTGVRADWSRIPALKASGRRVVLAGGLSCGNIAAAAGTGADILDVNSSLETAPGVKSIERLDMLISALREVRG